MQVEIENVEAARYFCGQLFAEAMHFGYPISLAYVASRAHFENIGLPQPDDILAFASGGRIRDDELASL